MYWGSICNVTDRNARGVGVMGERAYGLAFALAVCGPATNSGKTIFYHLFTTFYNIF